jgi:PelA/Pel-15E family pectate lyase
MKPIKSPTQPFPRLFVITLILLASLPELHAAKRTPDFTKKTDDWFRSADAVKALDCILSWQSLNGDWPKNKDNAATLNTGDRAKIEGTFDNSATTIELRNLARAFRVTGDTRYKTAFLAGFDHILKAQYPNGGWPQYYPLRKGYYTHITFNDGAMIRLMEFLRDATTEKDFSFLDNDRIAAAKRALDRGLDCILKCQVVIKGVPTVWCAQHDEVTLGPANARKYELPSLSGQESAGVLIYLMSLDKPSPEVIRAVNGGVAWFDSVKITGFRYEKRVLVKDATVTAPIWARFYELETNRPFFSDRDGIKKYELSEIGEERRKGYAWYNTAGDDVAKAYAKWAWR